MAKTNGGQPAPADFDLDAWIDGTTGITGTAQIMQRGQLMAELDKVERQLELAKGIKAADRGADDVSPETLRAKWEEIAEELTSTAITVYIQDRTEGHRQSIRDRLKQQKVTDADTVSLHVLADAIVKVETADGKQREFPDGFPPEKLRTIRDRGGDNVLTAAWTTFNKVIREEPDVSGPTSRRSSSRRLGST